MNPDIHFEIPAIDLTRAKYFYQEIFGWDVNVIPKLDYQNLIRGIKKIQNPFKSGYINQKVKQRSAAIKNPEFTIDVSDIESALEEIVDHGGQVIRSIIEVGNKGYSAYFKDTEDNIIGLWQNRQK